MPTFKIAAVSACLLLAAGCSSSGARHPASGSPAIGTETARASSPSDTSPASPSTSPSSASKRTRELAAPDPATDSPALARYGKAKVTAALHLPAHLAYYSVADPKLLGVQSPHSDIADYADVTRYLTPQAIGYLRSYIADQTTNATHNNQAAYLALANVTSLPGHGSALATGKHGLRFDKPFHVARYTATINPRVTLGRDRTTMTVTGVCSVSIEAHRGRTPVDVTFRRAPFSYYIQPTPSKAYSVGVSGWNSINKATVTGR